MKDREKAIRSQDIQTGLAALEQAPGAIVNELDNVMLTGMATRLATYIRGTDVFSTEDIPRLKFVASNIGIESYALPMVLNLLQEAEMVQVKNSGGSKIIEVRESVPEFGDLYDRIGQVYSGRDTSEIEDAVLDTFHRVAACPRIASGDTSVEQLGEDIRVPLLDLCDQAALIRQVTAPTGEDLLYAPQYWEENATKLPKVMAAYGSDVVEKIINDVRESPGLPIAGPSSTTDRAQALRELADFGILPSPSVTSLRGTKSFAFIPFKLPEGDPLVMNKVLEKTRAIIACVRYGQHFGTITSLKDPVYFLERFLQVGKTGSHSEIPSQYRILIDAGIARISRDVNHSHRFHLHLVKNVENDVALATAISLLKFGVPVEASMDRELHEYAKMEGEYQAPIGARAKRMYKPTSAALKNLRSTILEMAISEF